MSKNNDREKKENKFINFLKEWYFLILLGIAIYISYKVITYYISRFDECLIFGGPDTFGVFGDFIGGILNPTLAFLSFIALLITIRIQSKELKNSTEELAKSSEALTEQSKSLKIQNFENTFFNMINLHNEGIKNILLKEDVQIKQMRGIKSSNGFGTESFDKRIVGYYSINGENINLEADKNYIGKEAISRLFLILVEYLEKKGWKDFKSNYPNFFEEYRNILTHYFKLMYQIFLLIENNIEEESQQKYANIFKAQFTTDELNLIAVHLISDYTTGKYIEFVEKYSFFDSIAHNEDLFKMPIEWLDNSSFGTNIVIISELNKKREHLSRQSSSQEQQ
jgi:hypothetical protein